jgi:DNA-binding response OmpR family regulator
MRVLIAEDEKQIAAEVASLLEKAGYVTETVGDGEDAWFRGETEDYDAIIIDLGLPRLDGLSVIRRLREGGVETPILVLTARGTWMERVEGIDVGADDYLPKPFHGEELLARLGAVVRRSRGHATPVIVVRGMRIDTRRMTVMVDGREVALTPLEYRALRYLATNKDRVVPQTELMEHVYSWSNEPGANALEVLIARMRKKLGADAITTQRGHGYVIVSG